MKQSRIFLCLLNLLVCLGLAHFLSAEKALGSALAFKFTEEIPEDSYKKITQPILNPLRFMFLQPAAATGVTGFELGIAATGTKVSDEAKELAGRFLEEGANLPAHVAIPRLVAQKGIPFGIDLAANFAVIPDSDIMLVGGALQWSLLQKPFPLPSIAVRIGYTQLLGLEEFQGQTTNIEALMSFGIPPALSILKPYAGAGILWAEAKSKFSVYFPEQGLSTEFNAQTEWQDIYGMLGLQLSLLPLVSVTAELQASETQTLYSGKLSIGF